MICWNTSTLSQVSNCAGVCSRSIWITNSSDHKRVWTGNLLHTKLLSNPLWPSGLGNDFICKRFTVQTLLWSHYIFTWMAIQTHPFIVSQKRQLTCRRCTKIPHTIKSCPLNFENVWYPVNTAIRVCCR